MAQATRTIHTYETTISGTPEEVFPLLCPVREYDWIPSWDCKMIYSESGVAELGCIFTTDIFEPFGVETWVICNYQPGNGIGFIRTGLHRTTRYNIQLVASSNKKSNQTKISWTQEITALSEKGETLVSEYSYEEYLNTMVPLNKMLDHYLKTGEALTTKD